MSRTFTQLAKSVAAVLPPQTASASTPPPALPLLSRLVAYR